MAGEEAQEESSPSILFEVFALGQQVRRLLADAMAESPLTPQDYGFLSAVFEDETPTPTQLARRLGLPLSTTVEQVQGFEQRGYLRRLRNPKDGRSYFVTLTASGLRAHREANESFEAVYQAVVRRLGRSESAVARALQQLRSAVENVQTTTVAAGKPH